MRVNKNGGPTNWDLSDTPEEPLPQKKRGGSPPPPPVQRRPPVGGHHPYNPGMPPERPRKEAAGPTKPVSPLGKSFRDTAREQEPQEWPEQSWDITDRRSGKIYRVVAGTPAQAKDVALAQYGAELSGLDGFDLDADPTTAKVKGGSHGKKSPPGKLGWGQSRPDDVDIPDEPMSGDQGVPASTGMFRAPTGATTPAKQVGQDPKTSRTGFLRRFRPVPSNTIQYDPKLKGVSWEKEGTMAANLGSQPQARYEALQAAVRQMVREVVRKKEGGGGYVLYGPNKGKKKNPKPAGEFPTRIAAKRAELARFPPKDPEQLKKLRKRLDKLAKDPKKRAEAEKKERQAATKPKRSGRPAGARSKKKEALIRMMARDLHERLFHEEELPGSPWDERLASMHPDALSTDKKLAAFNKAMQLASIGALGDAQKMMAKALRGLAKVVPGEHSHDPERQKTFMPIMLDIDGEEVGPVHLYVDGGHVKIEVSDEARQAIAGMDPDMARDLRGGLMSFQEDALPKVDRARKAWSERDSYLDKVHGKLEKQFGGMSGVEHHLIRQLLNKARRSR